MNELTEQMELLYREKRYEEFFLELGRSDEGESLFFKLCREDDDLLNWWVKKQSEMWKDIFNNPDVEKQLKAHFESLGMGEMFDLQKNVHTFGFCTAEEIEKVLGVSAEEQGKVVDENPERFKGRLVKLPKQ